LEVGQIITRSLVLLALKRDINYVPIIKDIKEDAKRTN